MNPRIWGLVLTPRDLGARQERNEARRTALNVALREQVASYSAVEEDFRVLIMAMGSLLEAKKENIADIAMEKMGTCN